MSEQNISPSLSCEVENASESGFKTVLYCSSGQGKKKDVHPVMVQMQGSKLKNP